jgi:hypothetical protein
MEIQLSILILFLLGTVGATMIIVDSTIMQPVRDWARKKLPSKVYRLIECYQCSGFWVGVIFGSILISYNLLVLLICGGAGSYLSTFAATYLNYLEARSIVDLEETTDE